MSSTQSPFPPVRRVVTGHTPAGKSTVIADTVQPARYFTPESISPVYDLHYTGESPAVIDAEISKGEWVDEVKDHTEVFSGNGSNFRCLDLAPGSVSPLHRTITLDYAIVFRGSVTLELEEGERIALKEGDTVIQRGTMHTWRNESTEWAKMYFVMSRAKPIHIDGQTLKEEFHEAE
ncbi:Cupin-2 domain-containing protein [Mycena venus]|uniref:Cupin-2 domain-containing protein n=1 Tax=Mycena venus TaxID=2733690 RepID=A0A8H6XGJ9_9AGAR|nr:Cupin-2 domain-containing protein [Mycena venus]